MAVNEQACYPRRDALFHMTQLPVLLPQGLHRKLYDFSDNTGKEMFFFSSSTAGKHENQFYVYKM